MNLKTISLTNVLFACLAMGCIVLLLFSDRGFIALWNLKKEKIEFMNEFKSEYVGKLGKRNQNIENILKACL